MSGYSGGGGSGIDLTARLGLVANTFNDLINNAQAIKGLGLGFVDEFNNSTGIDAVTSLNETYDAVNDLYNNLGGYTADQIPTMTGYTTPSGNVTTSADLVAAWNAFDKSTATSWEVAGLFGWVAYQFTTGKIVTRYTINSQGSNPNQLAKDWTFEGSNDGTTWTVLDTQTGITWTPPETKTYPISNSTSYTYYRLNVSANNGQLNFNISEIEMMEALAPLNMTLVSTAWPVTAAVNTGQFTALLEPVDPVTLGTDFTASISNDGGATWVACPLTDYGDFSTGIKIIAGTATFASAGTSLVAKIVSANTKQFKLHGWSVLGG